MKILTIILLITVLFFAIAVSPTGKSTGSFGVTLAKGAAGSTGA